MSVYKRDGQETYSYDFRWRGERYSGATTAKTKREAERIEKAERERLKSLGADTSKPMSFGIAIGLYWDQKGSFLANSDDELRSLGWLEKQIGRATLLSDISDGIVAQAVAKRRGEKFRKKMLSPATVNRTVTQPLRAILRRAARTWDQRVQRIEWKDHFLAEPQERVREASAAEEAAFMAAMRGDYAPALRFALLTGCRREEIVGLRWRSVDFQNNEFTVTGKGSRKRTIPLTKKARDLLKAEFEHHGETVFTYAAKRVRDGVSRGQRMPITMEGFKTEWRRTVKRSGVADFRFHDTRHTAATRVVRASGNLKVAQQMLGHSDLATTSRYAHVTKNDLRAAMEAADTTGNATEAVLQSAKMRKAKGNAD